MKTQCPSCGQKYDVEAGYVGQTVQCTNCNANFIVKPMGQTQQKTGSEAARTMK
ncbi:MAG: zinc-ribbon domain-containing protein [Victivallales bacterium]|nr:zinc-ribbon domain-containing protein [Victivallales bacterium]